MAAAMAGAVSGAGMGDDEFGEYTRVSSKRLRKQESRWHTGGGCLACGWLRDRLRSSRVAASSEAPSRGANLESDASDGDGDADERHRRDEERKARAWRRRLERASPWYNTTQRLRHRTWIFITEPGSSASAAVFAIWILLLILASTVVALIETDQSVRASAPDGFWEGFEWFCMVFFIIEIVLRAWSSRTVKAYLRHPLNVIDVVIVLSFLIDVTLKDGGLGEVRVLRAMRLVRVARIFKLSRFSASLNLIMDVMRRSVQSLGILLFFVTVIIVIFSSALFFIEDTPDADARFKAAGFVRGNPFTSIPATIYWCVVSVTAVGYGDLIPLSVGGKAAAILAVISGSVIVAMPLSVISTHFLQATKSMEQEFRTRMSNAHSVRALNRLKSVAKQRAPRESPIMRATAGVVASEKEAAVADSHRLQAATTLEELDELEMLEAIEVAEEVFDDKIDRLVRRLTLLHDQMVTSGLMADRLAWR